MVQPLSYSDITPEQMAGARTALGQQPGPSSGILPSGKQLPPSTLPSLKREQTWNQMLADDPQLAGQTMAGQGIVDFFGGALGGIADIGNRLFTKTLRGRGNDPYNPIFQPESFAGKIGREVVGFGSQYPEGPIDHRSLSPLDQSLFFADLVDPSGAIGDIARPLFKNIPEVVAGSSAILARPASDPQGARGVGDGTRVLESITESGNFKIQDVSEYSMKIANDPQKIKADGTPRFGPPEGVYNFSHGARSRNPDSDMYDPSLASPLPAFDVLDAKTDEPLIRIDMRPSFDEIYRTERYEDYLLWGSTNGIPPQNLMTSNQFYKNNRVWHMDVRGMSEQGDILGYHEKYRKGNLTRKDTIDIVEAIAVRLNASGLSGNRIGSGIKGERPQDITTAVMQRMLNVNPEKYIPEDMIDELTLIYRPVSPSNEQVDSATLYWENVLDNELGVLNESTPGFDQIFNGVGSRYDFTNADEAFNLPYVRTETGPNGIRWTNKSFGMDDVANTYLGDIIKRNFDEAADRITRGIKEGELDKDQFANFIRELDQAEDFIGSGIGSELSIFQIMTLHRQNANLSAYGDRFGWDSVDDVEDVAFWAEVDNANFEALMNPPSQEALNNRFAWSEVINSNPAIEWYFDPTLSPKGKSGIKYSLTSMQANPLEMNNVDLEYAFQRGRAPQPNPQPNQADRAEVLRQDTINQERMRARQTPQQTNEDIVAEELRIIEQSQMIRFEDEALRERLMRPVTDSWSVSEDTVYTADVQNITWAPPIHASAGSVVPGVDPLKIKGRFRIADGVNLYELPDGRIVDDPSGLDFDLVWEDRADLIDDANSNEFFLEEDIGFSGEDLIPVRGTSGEWMSQAAAANSTAPPGNQWNTIVESATIQNPSGQIPPQGTSGTTVNGIPVQEWMRRQNIGRGEENIPEEFGTPDIWDIER